MSAVGGGARLNARDRIGAWILTGPIGRVAAFFGDLGAYWWHWLRRRLAND